MNPRIARTLKTAPGAHLSKPRRSSDRDFNPGAKAVAIRFAADGLDPQPVSRRSHVILQQHRRTLNLRHQQILAAAIPEIRRQRRPPHILLRQSATRFLTHFFESPTLHLLARDRSQRSHVMKKKWPLRISHPKSLPFYLRIYMPIRDKNIGPTIVVIVQKLRAKTQIRIAHTANPRRTRHVRKLAIVIVVIKVDGIV